MCLRVDPLKDAAGSPFGKADRLYLYLHFQKLSSGEHQDRLGYQCSPCEKLCTHMKCEVNQNRDMEMGTYDLMGGAFMP